MESRDDLLIRETLGFEEDDAFLTVNFNDLQRLVEVVRIRVANDLRSSAFMVCDVNKSNMLLAIEQGCTVREALAKINKSSAEYLDGIADHQRECAEVEARERGMAFIVRGYHVKADEVMILSMPDSTGPIGEMRKAKDEARDALQQVAMSNARFPAVAPLPEFFELMSMELAANDHKGNRSNWQAMTPSKALMDVYHHVAKLVRAVECGLVPYIREHAADVACSAMIVADVTNVLGAPGQSSLARVGTELRGQHLRSIMDVLGMEKNPVHDDTYLGMHSFVAMLDIEAATRELTRENNELRDKLCDARADTQRIDWFDKERAQVSESKKATRWMITYPTDSGMTNVRVAMDSQGALAP